MIGKLARKGLTSWYNLRGRGVCNVRGVRNSKKVSVYWGMDWVSARGLINDMWGEGGG